MSTEDNHGIPFDICHDPQVFRLLELPPALLDMITSSQPPSLQLKSAALDTKSNSTATNHAVLCTDDRTFHIRQVNSSNSIFILQPSQAQFINDEGSIPTEAVSAIAQPTATLELIPSSSHGPSLLKQILPTYGTSKAESEGETEPATLPPVADRMSKCAVLDNVPLSSGEFEALWAQMCAFEHEGQAWLPTATLLAAVWNAIISAATANSIDLRQSFQTQSITEMVREDGFLVPLIEAVVRRLRSDDGDFMDGYNTIDKEKCVLWVGVTILESQSTPEGIQISDFLPEWKGQLPEAWSELATIDVIKGKYHNVGKSRIAFDNGTDTNDPSSSATNASGKRLGRWHEKFKNSRR